MSDIALELFDTDGVFEGDIIIDGNDLKQDDSLETAVLISIFSDARVTKAEMSPALAPQITEPRLDFRGWWGNEFPDAENDPGIGSKVWLLERSKITQQLLLSLEDSIEASLKWLIEDNIAQSVTASAEILNKVAGHVGITVRIERKFGDPSLFSFVWDGQRVKRGFNDFQ